MCKEKKNWCIFFNVDDQIDFYRIARLREIDGEAVEYEVSYFDRRIVPFISREIAEHSIYHYLENELKLKISHSQRKIVFRYANEEEKKCDKSWWVWHDCECDEHHLFGWWATVSIWEY